MNIKIGLKLFCGYIHTDHKTPRITACSMQDNSGDSYVICSTKAKQNTYRILLNGYAYI